VRTILLQDSLKTKKYLRYSKIFYISSETGNLQRYTYEVL